MKKINCFHYAYDGKNTQLKITIDGFNYKFKGKIIEIVCEDKNNYVLFLRERPPKKKELEATSRPRNKSIRGLSFPR